VSPEIQINCTNIFSHTHSVYISNSSHSATHLVLPLRLLIVATSSKESLRLRRFKQDRDESWQNCSSSEYASIDGAGFLI